jgi:hypothetical protein
VTISGTHGPHHARLTFEDKYHVETQAANGSWHQISLSTSDLDEARSWREGTDVIVLVRTETYIVQ